MVQPAAAVEVVKDISAGSRILKAIRDNQLLTAAVMFILWQLDLFNSVIGYGCGV
jgi:hypothetical protein